jgi:NMD protein affecting ribosome stability and mRNA decay
MSGCPNCGNSNSIDLSKKDAYCEACGFRNEASYEVKVEIQEVDIVFCSACGVHYTGHCSTHGKDKQTITKFR